MQIRLSANIAFDLLANVSHTFDQIESEIETNRNDPMHCIAMIGQMIKRHLGRTLNKPQQSKTLRQCFLCVNANANAMCDQP